MRHVFLFALSILASTAVAAQTLPDGRIVEQTPCASHDVPYDQYVARRDGQRQASLAVNDSLFRLKTKPTKSDSVQYEGTRRELLAMQPMPRARYDSTLRSGRYECLRIRYISDALRVVGFIFRPALETGKQYPVVIYNRGGNREFGKIVDLQMSWWLKYLNAGFVIVASQYRGNDGGEGREEFGGADVRDVMNLVPLIRSLPYADTANIFINGGSRGGMMTYIALAHGIRVNAAAVESAPADLAGLQQMRPEFGQMWSEMIPDFASRRDEFYKSRSAIMWPERIQTPLLIQQGTADWRVDARDALRLAERLQELKRTYELVIYAGDDHGLTRNREEVDQRTLNWFRAHLTRRAQAAP